MIGTNIHIAFFLSALPAVCYSPGSSIQILEDPNCFFPDFQLYSGRHEASALTVEANGNLREKVGKFFIATWIGKTK